MIVHEARFPAQTVGGTDRSRIHANIDALLLERSRDETPRDYVWGRIDDTILIRSDHARSERYFIPVTIPHDGPVAFEFSAAPKIGHAGAHRPNTRRPLCYEQPLDEWSVMKLAECGMRVYEVDIVPFTAAIDKFTEPLISAMVFGMAEITNARLFRDAMVNGIAGAGPKCWGYGTMIVNWNWE